MKKRNDIAREIDERIKRAADSSSKRRINTAELSRNWTHNAPASGGGDNYEFGVNSLGRLDSAVTLTGHVKLDGKNGIEIETDNESNALAISLDAETRAQLDYDGEYSPFQATINDEGADLITVFRMANNRALYALSASQIWLVDETAGELVVVQGAVPRDGEVFTCARVFQGSAFIGTRETNGQVLVVYRFDGTAIAPELVLAANGGSYVVTSMCVVAMSLCALVGGLTQGSIGWRVFRRAAAMAWIPIIDWQANEYAGEISGSNELVASSFDGAVSKLWSVELGIGQTAPRPVVNSPSTTQLAFQGEASLSRYEREIIAANNRALWAITDAKPKTWSGNEGVSLSDVFVQPTLYTTPQFYMGIASSEIALGIESAGLFIFGARVKFLVGIEGTETITYLFGYDGDELIELCAWQGENAPLYRPVEVGLDGSIVMTAISDSNARYVWKLKRALVESLVFASRSLAAR